MNIIAKNLKLSVKSFLKSIYYKSRTYKNLYQQPKKSFRKLEIGAGNKRIDGFETLDVVGNTNVDYVWDASKPLPFLSNTFDLVYSSHILEHIPWYYTEKVLHEWVRILKFGGQLEIWVPDGLKICKVLMDAEFERIETIPDEWTVKNPQKNPFIWVAGRLFWGANPGYPSWHQALFTPRHLKELFINAGLKDVEQLDSSQVRGYDHGWINLGMRGKKK